MKQADLGPSLKTKRTSKREFLNAMNRLVPWAGSKPFCVEPNNIILRSRW